MFTKEELQRLRSEITLGSLYGDDYSNSFNVPCYEVNEFFDGYMEYLEELMEKDPSYDGDSYFQFLDKYDNIENLWNWYCCFEEDPL